MFPEPIKKFIEKFSRLPSIGPRLATRLGLYLAALGENEFEEIRQSLEGLKNMNRCPQCFVLKAKSQNLCSICESNSRDKTVVAVVEKETDIEAIEKSGVFKGTYLVLGDLPHNGVLPDEQKARLKNFKNTILKKKRVISEIIIALPQNTFGDFMNGVIEQGLKGAVPKITRLGRGIPTGGAVEFADEETLKEAIQKRG